MCSTTLSAGFISPAYVSILKSNSLEPGMRASRTASAKLVVVIDDDPLVREATGMLLRSWGCRVVTAESHDEALTRLAASEVGRRPDLIVCDYRLSKGATGIDAVERLRSAFEIPALLISGDGSSPPSGPYHLLHKPVNAEAFRAALVDACVLQR
jgi:two-component system, sensor histidine kinase